jgi:UDP-2,3-diacylglucosamine pyrophosphatase LpxH
MLVIASDLHLTDGSSGSTTSAGAFRIFANRLREMAVAASWRADGRYQPIDRIDIVLLGDVLDAIRSSQWSAQTNVRPWGNPHSAEFVDQITRITAGILANNDEALQVLRGLSAEGGVTVPSLLKPSGPTAKEPGEPVAVRIHYMVGNHDWFYHLPGSKYDVLRQQIIRRMGLANLANEPFPHDITESEELLGAMRRHKVTARHGDIFDPMNFEGDRDAASLGDVIVIELLNRFAAEVENQLAAELPVSTVHGLREIDNVRPLLLIPVWIDGLLERTCAFPSLRKRVKTVWDRLADEFLSIDYVRQRDTFSPFDLVDGLQKTLKFSKRLSIGWASSIVNWLNNVRGDSCQSYYRHALAEQDFRNRRSRHIVYGHTHAAENVALDASYAEGYVLNQEYFNAGTWRRVHRQTQLAPGEHEFIAQDVMSYLVFFQGDERKGRPYETWSGTLGFNPSEVSVHRIDPGKPNHAQGQSISAPGLPDHAPHFTTLPAESPTVSARWIE